jgi:hypothetical protein
MAIKVPQQTFALNSYMEKYMEEVAHSRGTAQQ